MQRLLLFSVVLLGASWGMAQDAPNQINQSTSQAAQDQSANGSGGETSVEGCLTGANGSYTLSDISGNTYQLTGDTSKLAEHVGHEIKVTGVSEPSATSSSAGSSAATPETAKQSAGASRQTLQISSVKPISKTCQSDSMAK
jgi:hypothetical protein